MTENHEIPESMLRRVQTLLRQAEEFTRHGETGSAEAAYARADAIVTKYAIDTALLEITKDRSEREKPVSVEIEFAPPAEFADDLCLLFGAIVGHNRCKAVLREWQLTATIVGFQTDVDYTQMMWAGVLLAFSSKINPQWDTTRPTDENIKILKEAGFKWAYIGDLANEHGFENRPNDGRLKAAYRRQCRLEGVEPTSHTQRNAAYRAAYATAFQREIRTRLYRMHAAAEDAVKKGVPGTEVALRDRQSDVLEKYYEMFPHLRPLTEEQRRKIREDDEARRRAEEEMLRNMTPKQRAAYEQARAREERRVKARYEREHARTQDAAGRRAGAAAARTVDLGAGKVGTGRRGELT